MKVVIACLNSKYIHASLAPWCLDSGVKAYCKSPCETVVAESTVNGDIFSFADSILAKRPDVVSFSCYIWNIKKTLEICRYIKDNSDIVIILGGPEVSYCAEKVLESYAFIDYVLCGEGETTYPKLLDTISLGEPLSEVQGLCFRDNGSIIKNDEFEYHGTPPTPYSDEFFDNLSGRIVYLETSRGCPYRCAFCLSGRCSRLRFFDMDRVKEDILKLSVSGTRTVKFVDRTFNADSKRANEIIKFILDNRGTHIPENVCFHFEIAGDILTEETFNLLESAPVGLFQLEIGMQSFNENTLKIINRKTNTEKLINNIKRLISFNNMHIHIDLIAGLTGENIKSFERSFDIGYSLKAQMLQMGFLKLLHGADMRENPEKYPCEFSEEPPYEVLSTPWLTNDEIIKLKKCEDALERLYNSGRFLFTLDYILSSTSYTPFRLFFEFGNWVDGNKMSLSEYALKVFEFFSSTCDKNILREKIYCDLLSCSSALQIPEAFKVKHPFYKRAKHFFTNNVTDKIKVAVINSENKIFVVNQSGKKDLWGRYPGDFYELSVLDKDRGKN